MEFELRQVLPKPPGITFELLTGPEFEAQVGSQVEGERTILVDTATDAERVRIWRVVETMDLPAFVRGFVGPVFEYTLEHRTQWDRRRTLWTVTPAAAPAGRVLAEGFESVEPAGSPQTCVRVVYGKVEVKAPVFGAKLADFIGTEVRKGFARAFPTVEAFVRSH